MKKLIVFFSLLAMLSGMSVPAFADEAAPAAAAVAPRQQRLPPLPQQLQHPYQTRVTPPL